MAHPEQRAIAEGVRATFMLSSKPTPAGYPDQYTKVTAYARIIAHQAQAIDPSVTATPGAAWQEVDDDTPFAYRDTATSRAGLVAINRRYRGQRIAIVGLGGTGSYILDQVAKTEVDTILLIDGDTFDNHNAFRAPGAPTLDTLRSRPNRAAYFASVYSNMHRGITAIEEYLDENNLDVLSGATFVFLASDDATGKPAIMDWLDARDVPFIDVGMGIEDDRRQAPRRPPANHNQRARSPRAGAEADPVPAPERDNYGRNIQTADVNALNAQLAVIRWKAPPRHLPEHRERGLHDILRDRQRNRQRGLAVTAVNFLRPGVHRDLPNGHGLRSSVHLDPVPHLRPSMLLRLRQGSHHTPVAGTVVAHLRRREHIPDPFDR